MKKHCRYDRVGNIYKIKNSNIVKLVVSLNGMEKTVKNAKITKKTLKMLMKFQSGLKNREYLELKPKTIIKMYSKQKNQLIKKKKNSKK